MEEWRKKKWKGVGRGQVARQRMRPDRTNTQDR